MATRIRLARKGAKKRPVYSLVVTDSRSPRDSKFIEKVGVYNPLLAKDNPNRISLQVDRIKYWLGKGATPTERVEAFLVAANLFQRSKQRNKVLDLRAKNAQEKKLKQQQEEQAKAAQEAASASA